MILAIDSSTLDADGGLAAAQSYLDASWPNFADGITLSVLTFASSVVVSDFPKKNVQAPELAKVGDSRAFGSMLRHVLAIYRSQSHLAPRDLDIVLAGTPTDSYSRELQELASLYSCGLGLIGGVSITAIGSEAAAHAQSFKWALGASSIRVEDSWTNAVKHLEQSRC